MRRWAVFLLALAGGALALPWLLTDRQPLVERGEAISPDAVAQARRLFLTNDPRRMRAGEQRRAAIPATLIDEAANYLASRVLHGRGMLAMGEDRAEVRLTWRVDLPIADRFLNIRAVVNETNGEPRIAAAAIGGLAIPARLAEFVLAAAVRVLGYGREWSLARGAVRRLTFEPAQQVMIVDFVWAPELLDRARSMAIAPADLPRFRQAQTTLVARLDQYRPQAQVPLTSILASMLAVTEPPSSAQRRVALLVLAFHLAGKNLAHIIPDASLWPRARAVTLTLAGREDSAQHFIVSAALAAWAGEPAADAIGLYKELDDARFGSGFSFADLEADRAGTRFGELLIRRPERIDALLAGKLNDADLLPSLAGLPEYLSQREFQRRFGGPGSPAYQKTAEEIDRRIAALPLYR